MFLFLENCTSGEILQLFQDYQQYNLFSKCIKENFMCKHRPYMSYKEPCMKRFLLHI